MTSVKEIRVEEPASSEALGRGTFYFTDDYSVFDWGQMPDRIPDKGASLCTMGAYNFERLEEEGLETHYRGVIPPGEENGPGGGPATADGVEPVSLSEVDAPPREMAIDLAQVPDLPREGRDYDYDAFHDVGGETYVVPLEVVFRNSVPMGSSLRRRTEPADHGLEYEEWPEEPVDLTEPIVEFSTKYEESDRYLGRAEAGVIAGQADVENVESLATAVNWTITEHADECGFEHEDGKIEVVYHRGDLLVADVAGTFDENRFDYGGQELSKEVLRQHHRDSQPEWVDAVAEAKERAKAEDVADWKSLCERDPEPLAEDVLGAVRDMYAAGANAYVGRELFDAPSIEDAVAAIESL